jgi:ubiquinol-cytochrome c reductase cytochrome c subunit
MGFGRGSLRPLTGWALLALAAVAGLALGPDAPASAELDVAQGDPAAGGRLWTLDCVMCHSTDGSGGVTPAGDPAPAVDDVTVAYARLVLRTHRMPPGADPLDNRDRPDRYDEQEMADVLAYMVERFELEGDVDAPQVGDPARGLELYQLNCAACHGATGDGGVAGGRAWTPRIQHYDAQVVADAVRVGPFEMPRFAPEALSDEDVGDIVAFLQEVEEEPGTLLFPGELNPVFASGFGAVLALAVLALVLVVAGKPLWLPDEPAAPDAEEPRT